ncbi:hypothetical protein RRG08_066875 [Elysia crispata]|uniref:Uncharacterized protein n=1 Tax=Elysia crispata TaxID=231223 RepID=A0AAE0ZI33_9GAST|nr:hypothetical protein RRG08_066875 [Elysia crispata]
MFTPEPALIKIHFELGVEDVKTRSRIALEILPQSQRSTLQKLNVEDVKTSLEVALEIPQSQQALRARCGGR